MTPENPRRWMLIRREMGIADTADAGNRWALDHLLIDQDAMPTFVECKRSGNPEIRRAIVGQMLEYAAHASLYWSAERIRHDFESAVRLKGRDPATVIGELIGSGGDPDVDAFWEKVAINLAAKHIRLLFVADEIPEALGHVVEFLNAEMPNVEVLAVELKHFKGTTTTTLVPRVIGRTLKASLGSSPRSSLTVESLLDQFPDESSRDAAQRLLTAAGMNGATFEWGSRGVSIRARCPASPQPVTVAWLYPGSVGWMRTKYFSFGSGILDQQGLSSGLHDALSRYVDQFRGEPFVHDASSQGVHAWYVEPQDAAKNIDLLLERMTAILKELAALSLEGAPGFS